MSELTPDSLFVVMYLRSTTPDDTTFHCGLYYHRQTTTQNDVAYYSGYKYHIRNIGTRWITDHGATSGVMKSFALICAVRVSSNIPWARFSEFEAIVKAKDGEINDGTYDCVAWVLGAVERLKAAGFITYNSIDELMAELLAFAGEHRQGAIRAEQPRPVRVSTVSS